MKRNRLILIGGGTFFLSLLIIIVPWYPWQLSAGLLLIAFLPGYALLLALWPFPNNNSLSRVEQWLIAIAVSYGLTITLLLSMVYAHLRLKVFTVAGSLGTLTVIFTLLAWWRQAKSQEVPHPQQTSTALSTPKSIPVLTSRSQIVWLAVVLIVAALFRIVNIYYSDYQGDEADILYRAVSVVYGQIDAILTHSKGPGEILLLNAIGALTGRFDELTARLPFALAGTAAVGLIVLLGWRFFNPLVGLVAGLFAAIDGVFVSYARTAQYQSVVLLLSLAAIYCFYRYYETRGHLLRWHSLGSFLLAASFLVHFETVLLLPVVGYLTIAPRLKQDRIRNIRQTLTSLLPLWPPALIFLTVTATFYIPFLLHPRLSETGNYLENRISGGSLPPFNNLGHFFYFEALKYNSAYYVILVNVTGLLVIILSLTKALGRSSARKEARSLSPSTLLLSGAAVILCLLAGVVLTRLGFFRLSALSLAVGMGLFFALVILSPYTQIVERILWLWLAPPFWVYVFLVNRPGKHHYLFLVPVIILVGYQLVKWWQWTTARWPGLKRPFGRWATGGLSLLVLAIFAAHSVMLFWRSDLEYVLTYPAHRTAFYPTDAAYPYGTRIGFGYPFRLGWQVVGQLKRTGQLNGTWAGNDAGNAPRWYMLGTSPTPCYPHYLFQGEVTYKGEENFDVPFEPANFGYEPRYRIWGNDRLRMTILEFDPDPVQREVLDLHEPSRFDRPVTAADFALAMSPQPPPAPENALTPVPILGEGSELKNNAPLEYLERAQQLNGRVALLGYDLEDQYAWTGGILPITLYWQTQSLLSLRYKVFVHLVSVQGELKTQADDFPVCGQSHANTWPPGEITLDRHLLRLPPDILPGEYTLIVGMYEPELNLRLNYIDVAGNEQGNSLTVGTITIRSPETSNAGS